MGIIILPFYDMNPVTHTVHALKVYDILEVSPPTIYSLFSGLTYSCGINN